MKPPEKEFKVNCGGSSIAAMGDETLTPAVRIEQSNFDLAQNKIL